MRMVQVINGPVTNGVAELNHDTQAEKREIRDGVTGEGQGLSEEDESRINEDIEDRNVGGMELVQVQAHRGAIMQRSQQQPQGSLVHWERFLPLRSLKVLLVENDDSTRHVVSALLRNCGYEVKAVSNGLQAWKLLEDLTNHIDLVLTEVVMPCLSGIGLLSKIMNHKTCKNIPVIMMSSHDSISIVFKCLSKGAVDFLVKPIRKNELKHLWQHIWRKCHSSSGSGSESGVRTQKSTKSKSAEESDNHTGSNNKDDIGSIGLNAGDGSDDRSGTQSSWTKRAVEVDSPKPMSPWNKLADHPDSTCAQVIHSRTEAFGNTRVPVTTTKECEGKDDELDDVAMGKDLEIGLPRIPNIQLEDQSEMVISNIAGKNGEKFPEMNSNKDSEQIENVKKETNSQKPNGELIKQAANLRGAITDSANPQGESVVFNIPNGVSMISNTKDRVNYENKEIPSLELGLKRLQDVGDTANSDHDQTVLRHSDISAFSRYNSNSTANQAPTGNVGSCSPLDNSSAAKTESMQNSLSNSSSTPPNQQSNGSNNNNDGSTTNNAFTKAAVFNNKSAPKPAVKFVHPSSACQTAVNVQNRHIPPPQPVHGKADAVVANTTMAQARSMNQQVQVQHHHHHYHHHHHHVHNISQQQQVTNHNELVSEKMAAAVPQSGSSNMLSTAIEGNPGIHGLNRSNSGRDHGSNGLNGSSTALNPRGTNVESDDGVAGNGGTSIGIGYGRRTGLDQNHSAQRDAALDKFRQKRKERCFEKKVRYQSRKKLAEQRPRFRGQFVRQATSESKEKNAPS